MKLHNRQMEMALRSMTPQASGKVKQQEARVHDVMLSSNHNGAVFPVEVERMTLKILSEPSGLNSDDVVNVFAAIHSVMSGILLLIQLFFFGTCCIK